MRAPSCYETKDNIMPKYTGEHGPCGFTMNISSMGHRHLIHIVKRNTETDGMGPLQKYYLENPNFSKPSAQKIL